jgi:predicted O-linked N-acetylglucosamine transferase (SPINDLY family)
MSSAADVFNRALATLQRGEAAPAAALFEKFLKRHGPHPGALNLLAVAQLQANNPAAAIAPLRQALALAPPSAATWANLAAALTRTGAIEEAAAAFDAALALAPQDAAALTARGHLRYTLARFEETAADFQAAFRLAPDHPWLIGDLLNANTVLCDWDGLEPVLARARLNLRAGREVLRPLTALHLPFTPEEQLMAARLFVAHHWPAVKPPLAPLPPPADGRIRIGYFSSDLRAHAVGFLSVGLIEAHDRAGFEIHGFDYSPPDGSDFRRRITGAFNHCHDITGMTAAEAARLARDCRIDIAIDLNGHTLHGRTGIFAERAAPVQVNFLGYPGSMGSSFHDYLIADPVVLPQDEPTHCTETVLRMPHCYQCNDAQRVVGPPMTRAEAGLPDDAFVFASFNATHKLMPDVFETWLELLAAVPGSVLWQFDTMGARKRLAATAAARGIAPERLIFAGPVDQASHLARLQLADLALDTLPYNAHTTASDAMWVGLPLLTQRGTTFAGRVAASILTAAGAPELITESREDYRAMALALARDPARLAALREKLAGARQSPLFDTPGFARAIEALYRDIVRRP